MLMQSRPLELKPNTVILDTETTGFKDAEICEISVIDINGNKVFDTLIKPSNPIPQQATAIHGITNEMVASAPTFAEIHEKLIEALTNKSIIIYNSQFDIKMLLQTALISDVDLLFYSRLDSQSRCAMNWYGGYRKDNTLDGKAARAYKLTDAYQYEGLDTKDIQAHRAYADCLMTLNLIKTVNQKIQNDNGRLDNIDTVTLTTPPSTNSISKEVEPLVTIVPIEEKLSYTPVVINFDVEYFKKLASEVTAKYQDLLVTEEMLPEIKKEIAQLNKLKDDLNDSRISIAREIKAPIADFEKQVKEIIAIVDIPAINLKSQYDAFEEKRKADATKPIQELIDTLLEASELDQKYHAQVVLKPSYLNKSATINKIKAEIQANIDLLLQQQTNEKQALEIQKQQLANRELKLQNLNAKFGMEVMLADVHNLADDKLSDYFVELDTKRVAKALEADLLAQSKPTPLPLQAKPVNIAPKPAVATQTNSMVYKNIRIGGANMGVILQAIAPLRANSLVEVKFID